MQTRNIVIIGADPDLVSLVHTCLSAQCVPLGILFLPDDPYPAGPVAVDVAQIHAPASRDSAYMASLPASVPRLDEEAFLKIAADPQVEILAGSYGLRERDNFMRVLLHCKNKLKLSRPVRHPAYLLDRLSVNCRGYICAGYPGSGNMLVQNILHHLAARRPPQTPDPLRETARVYAFYHWSSLRNYIESHFYDAGLWRTQTSVTHRNHGALYLDLAGSDRPSVLSGLPMHYPLWANPWTSSHEPPTREAVDYFDKNGFSFIFIARNPLDIIISLAAKTTSLAKSRAPVELIDNRRWFKDALSSVVQHYHHAKENKARLIIARYEDFLGAPKDAIVKFASTLGVSISAEEAEALWHTVAGVTLSADPGHYWQPSEGKWIKYIPEEYRSIIEDSGVIQLAKEFGYTLDMNRLNRKCEEGGISERPDQTILALEENRWLICAGKPPSIDSSAICVIRKTQLMAATYPRYKKYFNDLLSSSIFHWLLASSGDMKHGNFISTDFNDQPEPKPLPHVFRINRPLFS